MVINTSIMVAIQRLTTEKLRGGIAVILGTLSGGIAPLGGILAGVLIDKIHPRIILSVSGVIVILAAVNMMWNKEIKSL
ncbi:hypothetical protein [Clostridium sp.]|uniref:hypothetical protein n=1 Tax=Clostridium sp. TaxID=1506 RepID=UPI00283D39B5|nr:hypothetical protein [Clostridium sp.]MDR3598263.1 hypothetical protein [Clostridium sp.]